VARIPGYAGRDVRAAERDAHHREKLIDGDRVEWSLLQSPTHGDRMGVGVTVGVPVSVSVGVGVGAPPNPATYYGAQAATSAWRPFPIRPRCEPWSRKR
jgi:hypothetical protein